MMAIKTTTTIITTTTIVDNEILFNKNAKGNNFESNCYDLFINETQNVFSFFISDLQNMSQSLCECLSIATSYDKPR